MAKSFKDITERFDFNRAAIAKQRIQNLRHAGGKVRGNRIANLLRTAGVREESEIDDATISQLDEVLSADAGADKWIHDFVHSTNPKFDGKSKKERINMALGAYYDTHKKKDGISEEQLDEKSDQAKQNKTMKNMMDASRGAKFKLNNPVPDAEPQHKTAQAYNKALGRALRKEESMKSFITIMNEDIEQLDELSLDTLKSYVKGAKADKKSKEQDQRDAEYKNDYVYASDSAHKAAQRKEGIKNAKAKMNKEEAEQIDEISLDTMKSAKDKLQDRAYDAHMDDNKSAARHFAARYLNMKSKIAQKQRKLAKEEIEQVDERIIVDKDGNKIGGGTVMDRLKTLPPHKFKPSGREALNGNQHKIDKNKNGKVDAHDFKLLRKEESAIEEGRNEGDVPFDKPYKTVTSPVTKDKSGATHDPMSRARHIARMARDAQAKKMQPVKPLGEAKSTGPVNVDKVHAAGQEPHEEKWVPAKKVRKEEFDADGNVTYAPMTYNDFAMMLEYEADKSGKYVHKGSYGSEFAKAEREKDEKGFDAEPAKRGPKVGSKRGTRVNLGNSKLHKTI